MNVVEVKDGKIIINSLTPGRYRIKYFDEDLVIEITNDGRVILHEVVDEEVQDLNASVISN